MDIINYDPNEALQNICMNKSVNNSVDFNVQENFREDVVVISDDENSEHEVKNFILNIRNR